LAAAATRGSFFTNPKGGILTGAVLKDDRHTNLVQAGRLEMGNEFKANAVSLHIRQSVQAGALPTVADIKAVSAGNMRLLMGGATEYLKSPCCLIPSGGADFVHMSNIAAAVTEFSLTRGVAVTQNRFYLDEPIVIRSQESFEIILENMDAIVAPVHAVFVLWGTYLRPVR
jgi:hypothetical protein